MRDAITQPGGELRLRAMLRPRGPAAAVVLTDEQVAAIGGGAKAPPVTVTVNGHTFDGRIGRRGGEALLGFSRAVREACNVEAGDEIELVVALATEPPKIEVPPALAAALDGDPVARERFEQLAPSHRKEFARWVADAKRDETRDRRVAQALDMLHEGRTR
ncbi:MAG TPA: YdeI/OmpD-associated family protein [Conexibacter sp.]